MIKKITILILILVIGLNFSFAKNVSLETARKAGIHFFAEHKTVDYSLIRVSESHTEMLNGEPVYYAFNFTDQGFIIVSAEDAVTPVLAYSYEGRYSGENPPPQFISWMEGYAKQIGYSRTNGTVAGIGVAV